MERILALANRIKYSPGYTEFNRPGSWACSPTPPAAKPAISCPFSPSPRFRRAPTTSARHHRLQEIWPYGGGQLIVPSTVEPYREFLALHDSSPYVDDPAPPHAPASRNPGVPGCGLGQGGGQWRMDRVPAHLDYRIKETKTGEGGARERGAPGLRPPPLVLYLGP